MKYSDYLFLCNEHTINPNVAAQNPKVRELLISDKGAGGYGLHQRQRKVLG
jgi:hypothetical protein